MRSVLTVLGVLTLISTSVGCGNGGTSYSLLADGETFYGSSTKADTKIDVLWVIDNSGSMASSQTNLANNFPSFINSFSQKGFDFTMAVTTTDAYLALSPMWDSYFNLNPKPFYYEGLPMANKAKFRDGVGSTHSGVFVLDPNTPNLQNVFVTNVMQGTNGRGDERSLQSIEAALKSPLNSGFIRQNAFLAVIIVTDEDDFSNSTQTAYQSYVSQLTPLSYYTDMLDGLTNSNAETRHYSVNTISINTQTCLNSINNGGGQKIGQRVGQMADLTDGIKGDICGNFADELDLISKKIASAASEFFLGANKKPIPETIRVFVDGVEIPNADTNPANDGGWRYNATANSITFTGQTYLPAQGSAINVTFDPQELTF
ncbi:MAG: hypothetical protein AB7F86_00470 [Bdellovibrionales bacterium]